jgi:hypothetical protein
MQDAIHHPTSSFGFLLQLLSETGNRSLNFASGNCANPSKRPVLHLCLQSTVGINEINISPSSIYPNPASDELTVSVAEPVVRWEIVNLNGTVVGRCGFSTENYKRFHIDTKKLCAGFYILHLTTTTGSIVQKFEVIH